MAEGMIQIDLDQSALDALRVALRGIPGAIGKATALAANETAKKLKVQISRNIRERVPIKKKDIDRFIKIDRANPSDQSPQATVRLSKSQRIPLQYFGANQTSTGVQYNIGKRFAPQAFMGPKPGAVALKLHGGVFARIGLKRLPIRKLFGPSPWGVFVKAGLMDATLIDAKTEMEKQLVRAANFILLKNAGVIA